MSDRFLLARALVDVRLAELRHVLERHEAEQRAGAVEKLERLEVALAVLVDELRCRT